MIFLITFPPLLCPTPSYLSMANPFLLSLVPLTLNTSNYLAVKWNKTTSQTLPSKPREMAITAASKRWPHLKREQIKTKQASHSDYFSEASKSSVRAIPFLFLLSFLSLSASFLYISFFFSSFLSFYFSFFFLVKLPAMLTCIDKHSQENH